MKEWFDNSFFFFPNEGKKNNRDVSPMNYIGQSRSQLFKNIVPNYTEVHISIFNRC